MNPISIKTQQSTLAGVKGVAPKAPPKPSQSLTEADSPKVPSPSVSSAPAIQSVNGVRTITGDDGAIVKNTDSGMSSIKTEDFQSISLGRSGETFKIVDGKIEATGGAQNPKMIQDEDGSSLLTFTDKAGHQVDVQPDLSLIHI